MTTEDLTGKSKSELQDMSEELGLPTSGTKEELADRIEEALADAEDPAAEDAEEESTGPTGPTMSPVHEPEVVQPATLAEAGEPQPSQYGIDDGVEDIEAGRPVVGQWVQITGGDYTGRFAAYLGDVSYEDRDPDAAPDAPLVPAVVQVRTRDADNLVLDVPYEDVSSTAYSGGR